MQSPPRSSRYREDTLDLPSVRPLANGPWSASVPWVAILLGSLALLIPVSAGAYLLWSTAGPARPQVEVIPAQVVVNEVPGKAGGKGPSLAVLEFKLDFGGATRTTKTTVNAMRDSFREGIRKLGGLSMPAGKVGGGGAKEDAQKIGRDLGVDLVVATELRDTGPSITFKTQVIEVASGKVLFKKEDTWPETDASSRERIAPLTRELVNSLRPIVAARVAPPPRPPEPGDPRAIAREVKEILSKELAQAVREELAKQLKAGLLSGKKRKLGRDVVVAVLNSVDTTGPLAGATVAQIAMRLRTKLEAVKGVKQAARQNDFSSDEGNLANLGRNLKADLVVTTVAFDEDGQSHVRMRVFNVATGRTETTRVVFGKGDEAARGNLDNVATQLAAQLRPRVTEVAEGPAPDDLDTLVREMRQAIAELRGGAGKKGTIAILNTVDTTGPIAVSTVHGVAIRLRKRLSDAGVKQPPRQTEFTSKLADLQRVGQELKADVVVGTVAFDEGGQSHVRMTVVDVASGRTETHRVVFGMGPAAALANLDNVASQLTNLLRPGAGGAGGGVDMPALLREVRQAVAEQLRASGAGGGPAHKGELNVAIVNSVDNTGPLSGATVSQIAVRLRTQLANLKGVKQSPRQTDSSSDGNLKAIGKNLGADVVVGTVAFDDGGQSHVRMTVIDLATGKSDTHRVVFGKGDEAAKANLDKVGKQLADILRPRLLALATPPPGAAPAGALPGSAGLDSVAVLPFTVEAPVDAASKGVIAGWTAEMPRLLARTGRLRVAPARKVTGLKATGDVQAAGRALGVRAVLTGKARLAENKALVIEVELIEVGTDFLLWAEEFTAIIAPADRLAVLNRTAQDIANQVKTRLGPAPR